MLDQTLAIFVDAYRELNNRKLFWLTLVLSGLVVAVFAVVGYSDDGELSVLGYQTPIPLAALGLSREDFYKLIFLNFGVNFWLAWLATILGLVSTAGMIPNFIAAGAIDIPLSKPIGRFRLFLTKYAAGLIFVALQVAVFTVASFLVIGLRGGAWEFSLFLAIPLVIVFFSYLFSVCALLGLLTRSTITALLLTLLFWFGLFLIHTTEATLVGFKEQSEQRVEELEERVETLESPPKPKNMGEMLKNAVTEPGRQDRLERAQTQLESAREDAESLRAWHNGFYAVKTVLPKTAETIDLLRRALVDLAELPQFDDGQSFQPQSAEGMSDQQRERFERRMEESEQRTRLMLETLDRRSIAWVLGSSLGFEAVLLALCCWVFSRRDF